MGRTEGQQHSPRLIAMTQNTASTPTVHPRAGFFDAPRQAHGIASQTKWPRTTGCLRAQTCMELKPAQEKHCQAPFTPAAGLCPVAEHPACQEHPTSATCTLVHLPALPAVPESGATQEGGTLGQRGVLAPPNTLPQVRGPAGKPCESLPGYSAEAGLVVVVTNYQQEGNGVHQPRFSIRYLPTAASYSSHSTELPKQLAILNYKTLSQWDNELQHLSEELASIKLPRETFFFSFNSQLN